MKDIYLTWGQLLKIEKILGADGIKTDGKSAIFDKGNYIYVLDLYIRNKKTRGKK